MKLLGIDYGLKRIGLSYSEGSLAQPMGKLTVKSPTDALQKVLRAVHEFEADTVVIGLPDPDRIGAEEFGNKLEFMGKIKVEFVDETLTSQVALERLKGNTLKKRRAMIDSAAATLILASYLEGNALRK
jgi:putative transcription antitermination factor YqgF